jgi:steroid 5-alpha reductase family enzyme
LTITYFVAQNIKDLSIIDFVWGIGFIVQCGAQLLCRCFLVDHKPLTWRPLLVLTLVALWGIRLTWHIASRHTEEDWRYKLLRKKYGHPNQLINSIKLYLMIFILQWVMMCIGCIAPLNTIKNSDNSEFTLYDKIGLGIFVFGYLFEVIADYQLSQYVEYKKQAKKEGKQVKRFYQGGLWKYSRHPNYFGEVVLWWGIYILSLSTPGHIFTNILSPVLINYLLRYLSGVPFLEKYGFGKDPEFKEYAAVTPIFIPWFPKDKSQKIKDS